MNENNDIFEDQIEYILPSEAARLKEENEYLMMRVRALERKLKNAQSSKIDADDFNKYKDLSFQSSVVSII